MDADALDRVIGRWLADQQPPATPWSVWRAVAVDGKTPRGSRRGSRQVHLLAVMDHATRAVLAQTAVNGAINEITRLRPPLDGLDLTG